MLCKSITWKIFISKCEISSTSVSNQISRPFRSQPLFWLRTEKSVSTHWSRTDAPHWSEIWINPLVEIWIDILSEKIWIALLVERHTGRKYSIQRTGWKIESTHWLKVFCRHTGRNFQRTGWKFAVNTLVEFLSQHIGWKLSQRTTGWKTLLSTHW